jgi:hypothetical protein
MGLASAFGTVSPLRTGKRGFMVSRMTLLATRSLTEPLPYFRETIFSFTNAAPVLVVLLASLRMISTDLFT